MDILLTDMQAILTTTTGYWQRLAQTVPAELLARSPAPNEWSALSCLQHIIDVEQVLRSRLEAFMEGRDIPNYDPEQQGSALPADRTPAEVVEEFSRLRRENLAALARLQSADLERQARHEELGLVTLRQMLNHWPLHDLNHTIQAERALMQNFIHGCGPWQEYYQEHLM